MREFLSVGRRSVSWHTRLNGLRTAFALAGLAVAPIAFATTITFDNLTVSPDPDNPTAVTTQYQSKGLLVAGAIVDNFGTPGSYDNPAVSGTNFLYESYLTAGPEGGVTLSFVDSTLPRYVSLYVTGGDPYAVLLRASGPSGFLSEHTTSGSFGCPEPLQGTPGCIDTPYKPRQLVSFYSATGISQLFFNGYAIGGSGKRGFASIDNLTYSATAPVPEPSAYLMLSAGLLLCVWRARRFQARASIS